MPRETDCFAAVEYGCAALREKECCGCRFYKPKEQMRKERADAVKHLKDTGSYAYYHEKYRVK